MVFVKFLAAIALIVSTAWVIANPGFESALAVLGSISALASTFIIGKRRAERAQHQSVSQSSVGVQAGGNVSIGDAGKDKHDR
ncbi:MAG: hypothetical protein BVN28_00200 [Nitrospira sp. ST-bin4]|nr:MAG: hypothetical protein BVN28_00200 [Nitrospira sp. ST-bin4]